MLVLTPLTSSFSISPLGRLPGRVRVKRAAEDREGEVEEKDETADAEEADVAVDRMLVFSSPTSTSSSSSSPPEAVPLNMLLSSC